MGSCGSCSSKYNGMSTCGCKSPMRLATLGVLFFILANPETLKFTLGQTQQGVLLHSLVFIFILYFLM